MFQKQKESIMNKLEIPQPPKPLRKSRKMKNAIDDYEQAAMAKGCEAPQPVPEVTQPSPEVATAQAEPAQACAQAEADFAPAIECPTCGFIYREDVKSDCELHLHVCEQVQTFASMYKDFPCHPAQIDEQIRKGCVLMAENSIEQRVRGAQLVIKACFARSLISVLMNYRVNSEIEHGSFDEYQRALIANELQIPHLFTIKLTEALARRYGAKPSKHLPIGATYWTNW